MEYGASENGTPVLPARNARRLRLNEKTIQNGDGLFVSIKYTAMNVKNIPKKMKKMMTSIAITADL